MEQKCLVCGTILDADSVFCHHCGSRVVAAVPDSPITTHTEIVTIHEDSAFHSMAASNTPSDFDHAPITESEASADITSSLASEQKDSSVIGSVTKTTSQSPAPKSRGKMIFVTAVAVVLITVAGFFGIEQKPDKNSIDLFGNAKTESLTVDAKSNKGSDPVAKKKDPSAEGASKPASLPPLTSTEISVLKQEVIRTHAEYLDALKRSSSTTSTKRTSFQSAVAKLGNGLQSYYVKGNRGTAAQANKELNGFLSALSVNSIPNTKPAEVKTASQPSKAAEAKTAVKTVTPPQKVATAKTTVPVKPPAVVKTAAKVTVVKPVTSKATAKKKATAAATAKTTVTMADIQTQKQITSGAYAAYMAAASHLDPTVTQKRAIFKANVAKLGHQLYLYHVAQGKGTWPKAKTEMRIFLISLEGQASPLVIKDIEQGVSTVK
ncbi:MAG: hypothetical protein ACM3QW_03660 [Ignavibacteriales bacterium]